MPSLLLYLLAWSAPLALRAAAAQALAVLLSSPHAAAATSLVSSVLPPFLIQGLLAAAPTAGAPTGSQVGSNEVRGGGGDAGRGLLGGAGMEAREGGRQGGWREAASDAALNETESGGAEQDQEAMWERLPPQVGALLRSLDRDVMDARHEWNADIRAQVIMALTSAVRQGGYRQGQLPYLQHLAEVSVAGFILHRLNSQFEQEFAIEEAAGRECGALGTDPPLEPDDASLLFSACVAGVVAGKETKWQVSALQRHMVSTIAGLARGGLVSRAQWSEHAEALLHALLSIMNAALEQHAREEGAASDREGARAGGGGTCSRADTSDIGEELAEGGVCGWLQALLRAATPAVSCDAAAHVVAHPSFVRVLVEVRARVDMCACTCKATGSRWHAQQGGGVVNT